MSKTLTIESWSRFEKWKFALKPNSWPKILAPTFLGQSLGVFAAKSFDFSGLLLGFLISLSNLFFIVLLNDWGDLKVDQLKRNLDPHNTSLKTIPDGILPSHKVLQAGLFFAGIMIIVSLLGRFYFDRPYLFVLVIGSLVNFQSYTFPPIKLNYRGGGECLEMFGVGFLLPLMNAYCQSAMIWHPIYSLLFSCLPICFASALASGLADKDSDLLGGKKTFATIFGIQPVFLLIYLSLTIAPLIMYINHLEHEHKIWPLHFFPLFFLVLFVFRMHHARPQMNATLPRDFKKFKKELHNIVIFWMLALSVCVLVLL